MKAKLLELSALLGRMNAVISQLEAENQRLRQLVESLQAERDGSRERPALNLRGFTPVGK